MRIDNVSVHGLEQAMHGMRNPHRSWSKNGTKGDKVGDDDMLLGVTLARAGTEHRKYLRMVQVWADLTAPRYWWTEFDTYRIGVTRNSCSTMNDIRNRPFSDKDFAKTLPDGWLDTLNYVRVHGTLTEVKSMLPEGYLQTATVNMNYEVLLTMWKQRKGHRLHEWKELREWVETLPFMKVLTEESFRDT
jgi:hypothetical protein